MRRRRRRKRKFSTRDYLRRLRLFDKKILRTRKNVRGLWVETNGRGLWSNHAASVLVTGWVVFPFARACGELRVYFNRRTWNVDKHGLIYTDKMFLRGLKEGLQAFGYSDRALRDLHYSEQGMQGDDYVSLDAGEAFVVEYMRKLKPEDVYDIMLAEMERRDDMEAFWRQNDRRRLKRKRPKQRSSS